MKPEKLLEALNDMDSDLIAQAHAAHPQPSRRKFPILLAAVIAIVALTLTAFASETFSGSFLAYFEKKNEVPLTAEQILYIQENEQLIEETHEENGWTVALRSAITDGEKAYIIIGITAPESISLEQRVVDDSVKDWFWPGNGFDNLITPSIVSQSIDDNYYYQFSMSLEEDGDGLPNTKNIVITLNLQKFHPEQPCTLEEPFGPDIDFAIHIEDIVHEYENEEYRKELMNGNYAGQTDIMFTPEESEKLKIVDTLVDGTWDFTVNFGDQTEGIELLSAPIQVQADIFRQASHQDAGRISTYRFFREYITVTSVVLRPLTVTLFYEDCNGGPTFHWFETESGASRAVMKDGSTVILRDYGASGRGGKVLEAESPIVPEQVDHILLADGTKIMVP